MVKLEKKRLTAFAIIGMVTLVVVVGLWLGQKKANSFSTVANTFKNNHLIKNQFFADKFVTNYL